MIDHPQHRRRHRRFDRRDLRDRDLTRDDFRERLRRRHGLARRAPGLERDFRELRRFTKPGGERFEVGRDVENAREILAVEDAGVGREAGLGCMRGEEAVARGSACGEPARRRRRAMLADAGA